MRRDGGYTAHAKTSNSIFRFPPPLFSSLQNIWFHKPFNVTSSWSTFFPLRFTGWLFCGRRNMKHEDSVRRRRRVAPHPPDMFQFWHRSQNLTVIFHPCLEAVEERGGKHRFSQLTLSFRDYRSPPPPSTQTLQGQTLSLRNWGLVVFCPK